MNRIFALLCAVGLLVAEGFGLGMESELKLIPGDMDYTRTNPALRISNQTSGMTCISLDAPEVIRLDTMVNSAEYQIFGIPGEPFGTVEGLPAVPQVTRLYRIPNTGSVELAIGTTSYHLEDGITPFPIQWEKDVDDGSFVRNEELYSRDAWYPPVVAEMSEPMVMRDFRVVSVTLYPVQVNTLTGQARVYDQLSVEIIPNEAPGQNELLHSRRPSGAFKPIYQSIIANLDEDALDNLTEMPGTYMIICKDVALHLQWADSLATWKRRRGYDVIIDARNNWSFSTMRQAIRDLYNNPVGDQQLEFACILGDVNGSNGIPTGQSDYFDHYFALMQDGDDLEDIGVGRLSCESAAHFAVVFSKLFAYERDPIMDDPTWFQRAFFEATYGSNLRSNVLCMQWARQQFYHFTGLNDIDVSAHGGGVNCGQIGAHLNEGVAFYLWRGSVVGEMSCSDASCGNGTFKLPVTLTITCGSGWFDDSGGPCPSECWLRAGTVNAPEGGVCGIGTATFSTHAPQNTSVAGGLVYAIANLGIEHIGLALSSSKYQLHAAWPGNEAGAAVNFSKWNNLMGEPSMSMWTQTPVIMNVTYPATVNVGARRVQVQVTDDATGDPITDAMVVVWKGDETYSRLLTDAGGFADVPVTVNTEGNMWLTVTKRNHKPVLADISCVPAARMVALATYSVDDDNAGGTSGNSDGNINPAEIIDLPIYLRNYGTSLTATNISATMSSSDARITIVNGTQTYATLAAGDSALGTAPFRISVSPLMMNDETAILTLAVTASGELTHSAFEVRCLAGDGVFISHQVIGGNGNGRLDPDETAELLVTIRNEGELAFSGATATLHSNSSFIAVTQGTASYGNIPVGQNVTNTGSEFELRANTLVYPGHQAGMMLVLNMTNGSSDTISFGLEIGNVASTDPTGPDAYGYYAYDDTDDEVEFHREFEYVNITGSGEDLNLNDPGEQLPTQSSMVVARALPFDFTFYGETYDSISICSNGWAAFGVQTEYDVFRNYPIPGQQAPDAMLAPFWDDLKTTGADGVWAQYDAENHRYIIQWKATGWVNNDGNLHQDFEIILLDPAFYETRSGDGIIIFQYQDVTEMQGDDVAGVPDVQYSTIGIQAPGCLVGLQYRFDNTPSPGGATLVDGRCVTFTTESRAAFGHIQGTVLNAETTQPMPGVLVSLDGQNDQATTDVNGNYLIEDVLIGVYTVRAHLFGFNDATAENVVIEQDSMETIDFSMLHPEILLSTDSIYVEVPQEPDETTFRVTNDGNGPLDYQIRIAYHGDESPDPWDDLDEVNISAETSDLTIQGCEFVGDFWWVSGGGAQGQNMFYRFDLAGNLFDAIPQPSVHSLGWYDLAYDGNLIYGSEQQGIGGGLIVGVDLSGTPQDTIPSPVNPSRAIAYDPDSDHFWVTDLASDLYEITRTGTIVHQFAHDQNVSVSGLAWNPTDQFGYKLYAFHRDSLSHFAKVSRIHPVSGDRQFLVQLTSDPSHRSGGCAITSGWNSSLLVFAGIVQESNVDRLGIWELMFNTTWITVTPMIASVPPNSFRDVSIVFDRTNMRNAMYQVDMTIRNNTTDSSIVVPVVLTVNDLSVDDPTGALPQEFSLYQNYPNPFNSETTFRFDLKQAGATTLKIYNLLGQEVATVVDGVLEAGQHTLSVNMNGLASGVYLYRLESGDFSGVKKLVLMK